MKYRFDLISDDLKYDSHSLKRRMDDDDAAHSLAERFVRLTRESGHLDIEDKNLRSLVSSLCGLMSDLSPLMLAELLHSLTQWKLITPDVPGGNFDSLWNSLDAEMTSRLTYDVDLLNKYNVLETFKVSNMFIISKPGTVAQFNYKLRKLLLDSGDNVIITKDLLINTLFLIRISQIELSEEELFFLEEKVTCFIDTMSLEEIGIICSTFNSKLVTKKFDGVLKDRLFNKIITLTNVEKGDSIKSDLNLKPVATDRNKLNPRVPKSQSMESDVSKSGLVTGSGLTSDRVTLNTILKLFKTVTHAPCDNERRTLIINWLNNLNQEKFKSLGVINLKHLIQLKNNLDIYIPSVFDAAIDSILESRIESLRMRDVAAIISYASKFGHEIEPTKVDAVRSLFVKSADPSKRSPFVLLHLATGLGYYGAYEESLIRSCFDFQQLSAFSCTVTKQSRRNEVYYLLLQLHTMVSLEANFDTMASFVGNSIEQISGIVGGVGTFDPILLTLYEIHQYRNHFLNQVQTPDDLKRLMNKLHYVLQVLHGTGHKDNCGRIQPSVALKQLLPYTFNPHFIAYHGRNGASPSAKDVSNVNTILDTFDIKPIALNSLATAYLILHPFHYTSIGSLSGVIRLRSRLLQGLGFKNVLTVDLVDLEAKSVPQLVIDLKQRL